MSRGPYEHGTLSSYNHSACRCDLCVAEKSAYSTARNRARGVQPRNPAELIHGKVSGYTNHGCRCEECKEAQRKAVRKYRSRKTHAEVNS
jgi:hypothetical protein